MNTIDLPHLQRLLDACCPHACFVPARLLRRVIKRDRDVAVVGLQVPHEECFAVPREVFIQAVEPRELGSEPPQAPWLILLPTPDPTALAQTPQDEILSRLWRLLFHARLDEVLRRALAAGELTPAGVRERIATLGDSEFYEVRSVLRQEELLLPPADDVESYLELVALFFELRYFAPDLIVDYFPSFGDLDGVAELLARDIDPEAILAGCRPPGAERRLAPHPTHATTVAFVEPTLASPPSPHTEDALHEARRVGNLVRAALIRARGADATELESEELASLSDALHAALGDSTPPPAEWLAALTPVLAVARGGRLSPEVRFLLDLQKVAVEHARPSFALDVMGWLGSLGRRPLQRALPARRRLWMTRRLQRAHSRVGSLRLEVDAQAALDGVLRRAVRAVEARVRAEFRTKLAEALREAGARPEGVAEEVARDKLLEELLDRMFQRGFLTMGELRDALSRSQLKLEDLEGPAELVRGDALLRFDKQLGSSLEGVHRRGEVYLRALQRGSALAFGTPVGRWLTRYLALPFGGAYVILEGLQHIVGPLVGWLGGPAVHLRTWASLGALGFFLLGLLYLPAFRAAVVTSLRAVKDGLAWLLVDAPGWIWRRPWFVALRASAPWRWGARLLVRPSVAAAALWWIIPVLGASATTSGITGAAFFVGANLLLNSSLGRTLEELSVDLLARSWRRFRHRIIPGLLRWILATFQRLIDQLERALYSVDEWLLFRRGQHRGLLAVKALAALLWAVVTYVVRLYVTLLIEPQINPIKHFPVVTVSHKIILPFSLTLTALAARPLEPLLGVVLANAIVGTTVFLLPGVFGFLVWELKENWRLYGANRPKTLRPVLVGSHGETIGRLLRPGFHSGTVPKIYARIRRAERGRRRKRDARTLAKARADLHHVARDVRRFVERELLAVTSQIPALATLELRVSRVVLSASRVRVELRGPDEDVAAFAWEEQAGWLMASWSRAGFVRELSGDAREGLRGALVGLYHLAGVQLIREHVERILPDECRFDVDEQGVVIWPDGGGSPQHRPLSRRWEDAPDQVPLRFDHTPVEWASWRRFCSGEPGPELADGVTILPRSAS